MMDSAGQPVGEPFVAAGEDRSADTQREITTRAAAQDAEQRDAGNAPHSVSTERAVALDPNRAAPSANVSGAEAPSLVPPPPPRTVTPARAEPSPSSVQASTAATQITPARLTTPVLESTPLQTSGATGESPAARPQKGYLMSGYVSSPVDTPSQSRESHTARLSDVQLKLQQLRQAQEGNTLMSRYLLSNSIQNVDPVSERSDLSWEAAASSAPYARTAEPTTLAAQQRQAALGQAQRIARVSKPRFKNKQVFKRKLVLLGYQEVGKTSLRKCFESEPFFFKRLPDVRTTTGVEVNEKRMYVDGEDVELILSDFAGQESYHSHSYFLTGRSIFGLIWKISAVEQDFNSSGINAREEERLYKWIAEVYAKQPRARIVLIATHLDELRVQGQRSVEMILGKVEGKVRSFIDRLANSSLAAGGPRGSHDVLAGNFAVSCKTRAIIAAGDKLRHLSGEKISALLSYLAEVAKDDCMSDREYPSAALPGRHAKLIEDIEQLKQQQPEKLLMPINELIHMAVRLGVESDDELLQVARLMHSWDVIYLLNSHRIEDNLFIMLHPRWLSRMAASLFSYAHVLRTPLHLRSFIGGLEYVISRAENADLCLLRKGFLRWPLARVLFFNPLADFLKRKPDDSDVSMCLQLLETMNILYPVRIPCDDFSVLTEESPVEPEVGRPVIKEEVVCRYFIPSLSPQNIPASLKRLAPVLFHRGVRVRLQFNFLPDELWWRLQCKVAAYIQEVSVHQPYCPPADGIDDDDTSLLFDGFRLKEADDEHNRWRDAMWLGDGRCRVLVFRESLTTVSVCSAETQLRGSEKVVQVIEDAVSELLTEYRGVVRTTFVGCPNPQCSGWLPADTVASSVNVTCSTCNKQFDSEAVVSSEARSAVTRQFADSLLGEIGELLSFCLSYHSCLHMCVYLGIPYRGPVPEREKTPGGSLVIADASELPAESHVEYLHALDKVVQAALFRSWMERVQERERRKRMLEVDPAPVLY